MANVRVDTTELVELRKQLEKLQADDFCQRLAKELAARLLRKVVKRTPVGDYSETYDLEDDGEEKFLVMSDKIGGNLRRAWGTKDRLVVTKTGSQYTVMLMNSSEYASYVEYGHRQTPGRYVPAIDKKLKSGWVEGKFMMTKSEEEIRRIAPALLEKEFAQFIKEAMET